MRRRVERARGGSGGGGALRATAEISPVRLLTLQRIAPPAFIPPLSLCSNYIIPIDTKYRQGIASINAVYIVAGVVHLLNAFQYIYAWFPLGFGLLSPVMIPEYLNVLGAALYLVGAARYNAAMFDADITHSIHVLETVASLIEVFAAFGWTIVWWFTFVRGPGRGLTLDDPDFTGNALIIIPSIIYFVYNVNNLIDAKNYYEGANATLYMTAGAAHALPRAPAAAPRAAD